MSIILIDEEGRELKINAWNWGVLHHLVAESGVFPEEVWAPKRYNGGGSLDAQDVARLAELLERDLLPRLSEGERMYFDGTVTDVPDDGTLYRDEAELWRNYSLRHDVLVAVIAFLRAARGEVEVS